MALNKVILIGSSHYHGLGLVRCFGEKGIKPYGIIIGKHTVKFVESSKYWEKIIPVETDEEAVSILIEKFGNEEFKPVVIPWSDGALFEIDRNYNRLKDKFLLASINGIEGEIGKWMNKDYQLEFAKRLGLPVSPTMIISIPLKPDEVIVLKESVPLPLFLKPVTSCEGSKKDMRKINSWEEFERYSQELEIKGFKRILVQEYMNIDVEYDFMGFCSSECASYTVAEKLRSWPANGGAASFAKVIAPQEKAKVFDSIIVKLRDFGYAGPFDMDIFLVGNKMYFNEVNWRSSANVYAAVKSGNNYPYRWFMAVTKQNYREELTEEQMLSDFYFMNEFWDVRHILSKGITLGEWIGDLKRSKVFAFWNRRDPNPFLVQITGSLKNRLMFI